MSDTFDNFPRGEMGIYNEETEKEVASLKIGQNISLVNKTGESENWTIMDIKENDTDNPDVVLVSGKNLGSSETSLHEVKNRTMKMKDLFETLAQGRNFE